MWSWILSVGTTFSQPLFSISLASVCIEVFPFLKWHTTTSTGFSCHYIRKIKWLIILEINSQLKSAAFKYSACKHEKLQHFGNVHRMKTSGRRHSVTWYQTFCVNPLAYAAACEAAGLARSINTQPAVRWNSETNPTSQHNRGMYWSQ